MECPWKNVEMKMKMLMAIQSRTHEKGTPYIRNKNDLLDKLCEDAAKSGDVPYEVLRHKCIKNIKPKDHTGITKLGSCSSLLKKQQEEMSDVDIYKYHDSGKPSKKMQTPRKSEKKTENPRYRLRPTLDRYRRR
jgi:hypothetical protein